MKKKSRKTCLQAAACVLTVAILLCSCGMNPQLESDVSSSLSTEQRTGSEQSPTGESTSQSVISKADNTDSKSEDAPESPLPPAPPVCKLEFTQTGSFPYPFEDELLIDEKRGLLLSTGQALYDYDTMWQLLEENYPCFPAIKIELEIDWEEIKADYRQKMEDCAVDGYISQENFIRTITLCLMEFRGVGHLFVVPDYSKMVKPFHVDSRMLFQNFANLMDNPKSNDFYSHAMPRYFQSGGTGSTTGKWEPDPVSIARKKTLARQIMRGYAEDTIPYLKITSFAEWPKDAYSAIEKFFAECAGESDLIIDVRGNRGGSEDGWLWIASLLAQKDLTWDMFWGIKSGALNTALYPELFEGKIGNAARYTDDAWREDFPYIQPEKLGGADVHIKYSRGIKAESKQGYFHGKIWVLIDENCYSATESFACFCKETGFAVLVGIQAGGSGKGGHPFFMALPYSGLIVEYEPYLSFNPDGTCNDITGTPPDIASEDSVSALKTCLGAIEKGRTEQKQNRKSLWQADVSNPDKRRKTRRFS